MLLGFASVDKDIANVKSAFHPLTCRKGRVLSTAAVLFALSFFNFFHLFLKPYDFASDIGCHLEVGLKEVLRNLVLVVPYLLTSERV